MAHRFSRRLIGYVLGVLAIAVPASVLAGSTPSAKSSTVHRPDSQVRHGWMAPNANPKHAWMYVSGTNSNNVLVYDLAEFGTPQIGVITTGINGPRGLSIDTAGNLYVANQGGGNVAIYPSGATTP